MKLIELSTKTVEYLGFTLQVPNWTKAIAIDSCGTCYAYNAKPIAPKNFDFWGQHKTNWHTKCEKIGKFDLEGMGWKQTLIEVK
jgi:hypothetical protein